MKDFRRRKKIILPSWALGVGITHTRVENPSHIHENVLIGQAKGCLHFTEVPDGDRTSLAPQNRRTPARVFSALKTSGSAWNAVTKSTLASLVA